MQFRKIAAVAGSALMAGMTLAGAATAATNVGNIASLAAPLNGVANFPIFVIGKTAQTSDVAGSIDIAVRMAAESKTTTTVTTTATGAAITGTEKDSIGTSAQISSVLPSPARTIHYSKLQQGTISWNSNTYDYYEDVVLGTGAYSTSVAMSHDFVTNNVNGTEKMIVPSGALVYEYVFNKVLNLSTATTAGTTGTTATPEYTKPIKITMLGKSFTIVGMDTNQVKMLAGATGTAIKDTTGNTAVATVDGNYMVYVTAGVDSTWATIKVTDKTGNLVGTQSINKADTKTFSGAGVDVQVTAVRVSGTDPTTQHIEADIVVGPTGTTTQTLTTSCDITATGSSNTNFPGETKWCMQVGPNKLTGASSFTGFQQASQGDVIQVMYKPTTTEYYTAGTKVSLPNGYGEVGYEGWNTANFVTITTSPVTGITGYNVSNTGQSIGNLNGIKITADVAGSIIDPVTKTGYSTVYALFNYTVGSGAQALDGVQATAPVMIGLYDPVKQKILLNLTPVPQATFSGATGAGYFKNMTANTTGAAGGVGTNNTGLFNYWFNISYGGSSTIADQQILNITFTGNNSYGMTATGTGASASGANGAAGNSFIQQFTIGPVGAQQGGNAVSMRWMNNSATGWTNTTAPVFRLGTSDGAETTDVSIQSTSAADGSTTAQQQIGQASQDVVADSGVIVPAPTTYTGSNQGVVKVPGKALSVKAYFGSMGAAATTGGAVTTQNIIPITTDVVKLDTEVSDPTTLNNNVVLVGGPCVNALVASLAASVKFDYSCNTWPAQNFALVKTVQDAFQVGYVAVVVAGTRPQDTDLASQVVQSGKLSGNNATSVKVTGDTINNVMIA